MDNDANIWELLVISTKILDKVLKIGSEEGEKKLFVFGFGLFGTILYKGVYFSLLIKRYWKSKENYFLLRYTLFDCGFVNTY